jgi:hypothetical protein
MSRYNYELHVIELEGLTTLPSPRSLQCLVFRSSYITTISPRLYTLFSFIISCPNLLHLVLFGF